MIHSVQYIAVLDTNVIYPLEIRDLLLWFAHYDLFTPKWSKEIMNELDNLMLRKGVKKPERRKRISNIEQAFPDANVKNYEGLIEGLSLPDAGDRHILAAAIKTNANIIVTHNLRDFPNEYLKSFGLRASSVDDFLADIIDLNPKLAIQAFEELVLHRRNPNLDEFEVLDRLRNSNLTKTANYLHSLL
jgi:predicted nucleic acid-binding protein